MDTNRTINFVYKKEERERAKLLTITAFLIGYALIDDLNSTEQNAVGNFFMLIGQTLCTNSADNFRRDFKNNFSGSQFEQSSNENDLLYKTKTIFDREINNIK